MRRPRRPLLVVVCAALLLAVAGLWVRGQFRNDRIDVQAARNGRTWRVGTGAGAVFVGWSGRETGMAPSVSGSTTPILSMNRVQIGRFDWRVPEPPQWSGYVDVPLWFVALPPATGMWWGWRRRTVKVGFPVEPAQRNAPV